MDIAEETEREEAIMVIQKYWRGFKGREEVSFKKIIKKKPLGLFDAQ
jgi:hypothetical protein